MCNCFCNWCESDPSQFNHPKRTATQRSSDQHCQQTHPDSSSTAQLISHQSQAWGAQQLLDTWEIGTGCHTETVWNDKGEERRRNRWRGRKSHPAFTPAQLEQLQWAADIWRASYTSPWPSSPQLRSNYESSRERERERRKEGRGFGSSHSLEPPILLCILERKKKNIKDHLSFVDCCRIQHWDIMNGANEMSAFSQTFVRSGLLVTI